MTKFTGWSRMAVPIDSFAINEVAQPKVGEQKPAFVKAEVDIQLTKYAGFIRNEWDSLREHDTIFLVSIRCPIRAGEEDTGAPGGNKKNRKKKGMAKWIEEDCTFPQRFGVVAVRGAEVYEVRDEADNVMNDITGRPDRTKEPTGDKRKLRVYLDAAQYHIDLETASAELEEGGGGAAALEDMYGSFNLLVRRNAKANNFKAILETIRDVMNVAAVGKAVPEWMHDIFLGYGDAGAAFFRNMPHDMQINDLDMRDTFVSAKHAASSFVDSEVVFQLEDGSFLTADDATDEQLAALQPPFQVRFEQVSTKAAKAEDEATPSKAKKRSTRGSAKKRKAAEAEAEADVEAEAVAAEGASSGPKERVVIIPYQLPNMGPFPENQPKLNYVPFTSTQVEAIRSGLNPGT